MPSMSAVEQSFCRSAPWRHFARRVVLPWALQGFAPHGLMLELGAGSGAMAQATARSFPELRLTATDIDPAMVAAAATQARGLPNLHVRPADVIALPFADGSFDVVASYLMLHHVVDWQRALHEAARVLRPGGTFVGYDLDNTLLAQAIHIVDRSPYRLVPHQEFAPALAAAGFERIRVTRALGRHVVKFIARKA